MTVRVAGRAIPTDPRVAWRSVRAEAISLPRGLWAWFGLLGALLLVGAVAAVRSLFPGDKGLGTTPTFEWGLLIVGYVFFAITTSGLCLASSLGTVFGIERFRPLEKRHAILAVLCLITAFGIIALDLHYPIRLMFGVAFNPSPSSPMWWMGVTYGFYLCVLLTEVWSMFTDHPRIHQAACTVAAGTAIVAPATLGAVFGVLASRPFWYGPFTPVLMVATALLSGTALLGIVFFFVHRLGLAGAERAGTLAIPSIRSLLTIALVLVSLLVARQVVAGALGGDPGLREATNAELVGPLAPMFLGVRVGGGLALPLLILLLPRTRTAAGVFAASCLALVGVFADRLAFVSAGQMTPSTAVSGVVSAPYADYSPSLVEVAILLGAVGFVATVYTLAERYVDLRESDFHVGISFSAIAPRRVAVSLKAALVRRHATAGSTPSVEPATEPATEPALEPALESAVESAVEPAVESALEPALEASLAAVTTVAPAAMPPIEGDPAGAAEDETSAESGAVEVDAIVATRTDPSADALPAGPEEVGAPADAAAVALVTRARTLEPQEPDLTTQPSDPDGEGVPGESAGAGAER